MISPPPQSNTMGVPTQLQMYDSLTHEAANGADGADDGAPLFVKNMDIRANNPGACTVYRVSAA
ncbi:hypothetical protein P691DRAFT_767915 [Macrolepiota fuliginosa MF-IS2]|uniref:Uncharacterized protein n=1 Tax=Macrolepiota fuliginosa MF-IS2 TaxID=1400762 RepID=A0A9P5WXU1_9AGAR|nr:hypothetical protein P691DRAFT_767915 [Macrolepiota fuliginosa MF-IS2]